jgi:methylthioribose-1-phosphate isomerase
MGQVMKKKAGAQSLVEIGHQFYERRWMWGTAGNLSMRLGTDPLSIAITPSSVNKGHLEASDLLTITDGKPAPRHPKGWVPSAETLIHQAIYRAAPGAEAVFHVHPVYSTLISGFYGHPREMRMLKVEWFEMMKGVGVAEEENAEVAIVPNWQDVSLIARDVTTYLKTSAKTLPVVLIYNHGLTGWGTTPDQARNHLEIMEYVCQYLYLRRVADRR